MDESARIPAEQEAPLNSDPRRAKLALGLMLSGVLLGAVVVGFLLRWLIAGDPARQGFWLQLILATVGIVGSAWAAVRQWRRWSRPVRQLGELLPAARIGAVPIEELSQIRGGLATVAPMIQDLLREVRTQRAEMAKMREEMSQRVAVRTDALERKIGSLQQQATKDPLTGLHNRRMFDHTFPAIVERCRTTPEELSLMTMDVDNFKLLNDTLGHAEGDKVLREIGQLIRSTIRPDDMGFRLGGDEFLVVMPGMTRRQAETYGQRLVSLVDQLVRPIKVTHKPRMSVGISTLSELPDPNGENLLRVADDALYDQKSTRRRRVSDRTPDLQKPAPLLQSLPLNKQRSIVSHAKTAEQS